MNCKDKDAGSPDSRLMCVADNDLGIGHAKLCETLPGELSVVWLVLQARHFTARADGVGPVGFGQLARALFLFLSFHFFL